MIQQETINEKIFLSQTTYYVYESEEKRHKGIAELVTSDKSLFERQKTIESSKEADKISETLKQSTI